MAVPVIVGSSSITSSPDHPVIVGPNRWNTPLRGGPVIADSTDTSDRRNPYP